MKLDKELTEEEKLHPDDYEHLQLVGKCLAMGRHDEYDAYKAEIRRELHKAYKLGAKNNSLSVQYPLIADDIYKAFGWQGGTIHQVVAEIKRLKEAEATLQTKLSRVSEENERLRKAIPIMPFIYTDGTGSEVCYACRIDRPNDYDYDAPANPDDHEPDCEWVKALQPNTEVEGEKE